MIRLRGISYSSTFCAVGARGFAGEGYPFHKLWRFLGMTWEGTAFAGKTMTLEERVGFMPLKPDGVTPKDFFPRCIWGSLRNGGEMVNQVGLSNFGLKFYLRKGVFDDLRLMPFMISIMLMESAPEKRAHEMRQMLQLLKERMPSWVTYALQINFACPNTGHDLSVFHKEMATLVKMAKEILETVPIVANVNALMPTDILVGTAEVADAFWIGNAIPFGSPGVGIRWERFGVSADGKPVSPLARRQSDWAGGLSSPDCLWATLEKVKDLRYRGVKIPIIAGNGIRIKDDVRQLKLAGADGVFVGSLGTVRPWRMRSIINYSNQLFSKD